MRISRRVFINNQSGSEITRNTGLKLTAELLVSPTIYFSFEEVYRSIYLMTVNQSNVSSDILDYIWTLFREGKWIDMSRWEIVKDVWLYPIRHNPEVKALFDKIINSIQNYDELLDEIILKKYPHIPKDIKFLISNEWR